MKKTRIKRFLPEIFMALKTMDSTQEKNGERDAEKAINPDIDFIIKVPLPHVEKFSIQIDIVDKKDDVSYSDEPYSSFSNLTLDDGALFCRFETNIPDLAEHHAEFNALDLKPNRDGLFIHDTVNGKTIENQFVKIRPKLTLV
tara:strand:+ start:151 stop:579 length:429 start_codon:yes stop_codon:yes gene_type:complete